jgi:hypothetical protein
MSVTDIAMYRDERRRHEEGAPYPDARVERAGVR